MRQQPRQSRKGPNNGSFALAVSCLASLYVVGRLWASTTEISHLRGDIASLTSIAKEQRTLLEEAERKAALKPDEPLFFNIRPATHRDIPQLRGPFLDPKSIIGGDGDENSESSSLNDADEALKEAVVAEIDAIEHGKIKGWACSRSKNVLGPLKIVVFINDVQIAEVSATKPVPEVPQAMKKVCQVEGKEPGVVPSLFSAEIPPLPQGIHTARVFVKAANNQLIEAFHSPALFQETSIIPDGTEALRRKDAIILRRNAELVSMWDEVKTQIPWSKAEAAMKAVAKEKSISTSNRLSVVVLAHSEPNDRSMRAVARQTWVPKDPTAAEELKTRLNVAVRFIVGLPAGAMQDSLLEESEAFQDILIVDEEGSIESDARRVLRGLAMAVSDPNLDADYYLITRDRVVLNLAFAVQFLAEKSIGNGYFGCMKSGGVVGDAESQWYEPDFARFGYKEKDVLQYPTHAAKEAYALSRSVARHIAHSRSVLHSYKYEDTSMGAWMLGLDVNLVDDKRFCCDPGSVCSSFKKSSECVAYMEFGCTGVCHAESKMSKIYSSCVKS